MINLFMKYSFYVDNSPSPKNDHSLKTKNDESVYLVTIWLIQLPRRGFCVESLRFLVCVCSSVRPSVLCPYVRPSRFFGSLFWTTKFAILLWRKQIEIQKRVHRRTSPVLVTENCQIALKEANTGSKRDLNSFVSILEMTWVTSRVWLSHAKAPSGPPCPAGVI